MRFRIERAPKNATAFLQICWQETIVPLRFGAEYGRDFDGFRWTWPDGVVYTLMQTVSSSAGKTPEWCISSSIERRFTGRQMHLPLRKQILRVYPPGIEWGLDGKTVVEEPTACCAGQLRLRGGWRLAKWRTYYFRARGVREQVWVEGIWRNSLPKSTVPVIVGMIVATLAIPDST